MQITNNNTIKINRGNSLSLDISIDNAGEDYIYKEGDVVGIAIYNANSLNNPPVISKFVNAIAGDTVTNITLTDEEMKLGQPQNYPINYWYEITLNSETVLGFDEDGAKILVLYPEGV